MDPRMLEMMQQQRGGGQPQAPQRGAPAQGGGQGENPFTSLLSSFGQQGVNPQTDIQGGPMAQGMMQGGQPPQGGQTPTEFDPKTGQPIVPPNQTQGGIITGITPMLSQAIGALQNVVKASTDRDVIASMRSIIALLSRFIEQDQTKESGQLAQSNSQTQAPPIT